MPDNSTTQFHLPPNMVDEATFAELEAQRRNSEAAEGGARPAPTTRTIDPAPDPIQAARQRASDFVHNICTQAQLTLRSNRDEIDNLMARMTESENALVHYIGEFAGFSAEVMKAAAQIRLEIEDVAQPFAANPPATLTQLKDQKE